MSKSSFSAKCLSQIFVYLGILLVAIAAPAYAQDVSVSSLSAADMITHVARDIPSLIKFVTALAYVMGMYFIVFGIMKLKQFGEQRTMMSQEHHLKGPMVYLIVGSFLLYLPTGIEVGTSTFWSEPNPYQYILDQDQWGSFYKDLYLLCELVGVIAFVRGFVILSHLAGQGGGGQGSFGRGLTHIIAGVFLINIYSFVHVILVTLGIQS